MPVFSVVVLTAAPPGHGSEAGGAFVKIDGREALLRSVELFLNRDNVNQITLVVDQDDIEEAKRKYGPHLSFSGVKILGAGVRWMEQIHASADKISPESTHVILHDAARPAVPYPDIEALMAEAEKHDAVTLVSPTRATLVEVDEHGHPMAYHFSSRFLNVLTPQIYSREKFVEMAQAQREIHPSASTLLKGSDLNIRIRGPGDATLVKTMLNMLPKPKVKPPSSPFEEAQW
jgi:2-C-methyl-D-erythritol 4-phosphate cytidylyltransferase